VPVACLFGTYGLSAHADRVQMVSLIEATSPRTVALVHGDEGAKQSLARSLRCGDVICARDGLTIQRSYPPRRSSDRRPAAPVPSVADLDIDRARNLLGPPGTAPLRAGTIAEAWFGQAVDRATVEQFARVLESVGLIRRDDHRRDRLWVLGVQETRLFPEEAELEEQLKQANPKGRLLDFCARIRIDPPVTDIQPQGAFYAAKMSLSYEGRTLDSGPYRAASKKTAEQMAAQGLLDMVSQGDDEHEVVRVASADANRLQATNPKGNLLEWCAKHKTSPPRFERDASTEGYRIRVVVSVSDREEIATAWYEAAKLKTAEQAAAEAILPRLPTEPTLETGPSAVAISKPVDFTPQPPIGPNPVAALNELTQAGLLQANGYELLDQSGPSHQPTFTTVAWATTSDGRTIRSEPISGSSKKSGQRAAAGRLLDLLVQEGITGR